MKYNRCGRSGLLLPALSLGLWHNFGDDADYDTCRQLARTAYDGGITHYDLADNYGPPGGAAERTFGKILNADLAPHRDQIIIATKAGHQMWPGPYGDWGSRKHLLAGLNQSLRRLGVDYVDIYYHHRPDPDTPLEETLGALITAVRQGKALYVGLSKYPPQLLAQACAILAAEKVPCLIHQVRYNLLEQPEAVLETAAQCGAGTAVFSPLAQGLLTGKYTTTIPTDSRIAGASPFLTPDSLTPEKQTRITQLTQEAQAHGLSLTHYALAQHIQHPHITTSIIGARTPTQLQDLLNTPALHTAS